MRKRKEAPKPKAVPFHEALKESGPKKLLEVAQQRRRERNKRRLGHP